MGRTLVLANLSATLREWPEAQQQSPAPQASLRTRLVAVQSPSGVQQSMHSIHRPVHRVACSPTARVIVSHLILVCPLPQFRGHFTHRCCPCLATRTTFETPAYEREIPRLSWPNTLPKRGDAVRGSCDLRSAYLQQFPPRLVLANEIASFLVFAFVNPSDRILS